MNPEKNIERDLAWEFAQATHCPLFLTGRAGTGKTTFLQELQKKSTKRVVVVAPTGVAAINAGGVTIHSLFQLSFAPFIPGSQIQRSKFRLSKEKINLLKSIDLLVIDEISMVRADLLDAIDAVLRKFRENEHPFGGVQLLMIGDLQQLSPVVTSSDRALIDEYYQSPYFFSSHALQKQNIAYIELQRVYRQSDPHFIELLNGIRDNTISASELSKLNERYQPTANIPNGCITLCTHNRRADAINEKRLAQLAACKHSFQAEIVDQFPESASPAPLSLQLRIGAQVMFLRNDPSPDKSFFNGKIGEVVALDEEQIEVLAPGESSPITVKRTVWEHMEYSLNSETGEIREKKLGTFSQFPLKLAWAITIHKSQGLSFSEVAVDGEAAFAPGQIYVALSRCRSLQGLHLASTIPRSALSCDNRVRQYMRSLQASANLTERLLHEKIRYQQQLMVECFNYRKLENLLQRFSAILAKNRSLVNYPKALEPEALLEQTNREVINVGENFARQLHRLFPEGELPWNNATIIERYQKASLYFCEKLAALLQAFASGELESDNSELKKRLQTLQKNILLETKIKHAGSQSCREEFCIDRYLRALSQAECKGAEKQRRKTVDYSEADMPHPRCFENLRQWRNQRAKTENLAPFQVMHQRALIQVASALPQTSSELLQLKGIGKKIVERYGAELLNLVAQYCQKEQLSPVQLSLDDKKSDKPSKGESAALSQQRFNQGEEIEEIAKSRGLSPRTIEGHLYQALEQGEGEINRFIDQAGRRELTSIIVKAKTLKVAEIKEAVKEQYSYQQIYAVLAYLRGIQHAVFGNSKPQSKK